MRKSDHVFETSEGWWCQVDGRIFGCWISRAIALAGMAVEQRRASRLKWRNPL